MNSEKDDFFNDEEMEDLFSDDCFKQTREMTAHPLEDFFDVDKGSTEITKAEFIFSELVKHSDYDDKDSEVERDIHNIYKLALEAYQDTIGTTNFEDPKYEVMNKENAAGFLDTALKAAQAKANFKTSKDKNKISAQKAKNQENNNGSISITQKELLRMLRGSDPIDIENAEFSELGDGK